MDKRGASTAQASRALEAAALTAAIASVFAWIAWSANFPEPASSTVISFTSVAARSRYLKWPFLPTCFQMPFCLWPNTSSSTTLLASNFPSSFSSQSATKINSISGLMNSPACSWTTSNERWTSDSRRLSLSFMFGFSSCSRIHSFSAATKAA